jgi:muconolactone delta-isomerase
MRDGLTDHLERQSVVSMECTIPDGMTIQQWRRQRAAARSRARRLLRGPTSRLRRAA